MTEGKKETFSHNVSKAIFHCVVETVNFFKVFNSTKRQNFGCDQIQSICRGQFKFTRLTISFFDRVENMVGKGENAVYQHFLLFPQCFSQPFSFG